MFNKSIFILIGLFLSTFTIGQKIGINNPNPQTALDINGALRMRSVSIVPVSNSINLPDSVGYLILENVMAFFTIIGGETYPGRKLIIENNSGILGELGSKPTIIESGTNEYIVNEANEWVRMGLIKEEVWSLNGNFGTIPGNNTLGTRDNVDLSIETNDIERIRIKNDGRIGIGISAAHSSALLDLNSTNKGILPPRMTKVQRDAIPTPAEGLLISCNDCNQKGLYQYISGAWKAMISTNTGNYGTVVNPVTGKVWLDRNLGASQVATSATDVASYGDLYQWGRGNDGHNKRASNLSGTILPDWITFYTDSLFIINTTAPYNWFSSLTSDMWSGLSAENNPCPSGFRIPTHAEWVQELKTWSTINAVGAFGSPLKLPLTGYRDGNDGTITSEGILGNYWSSTVRGSDPLYLFFGNTFAGSNVNIGRVKGHSVRCIKE